MYYLYLLYSKSTKKFYVGTTSDLKKRFYSHNNRENIATKHGAPWQMMYYKAYPTKEDALNREHKLKRYGQALRQIKSRITLVDPQEVLGKPLGNSGKVMQLLHLSVRFNFSSRNGPNRI
jgi:putative endonuclease